MLSPIEDRCQTDRVTTNASDLANSNPNWALHLTLTYNLNFQSQSWSVHKHKINVNCRLTNYELLRWLVETPSRDFAHIMSSWHVVNILRKWSHEFDSRPITKSPVIFCTLFCLHFVLFLLVYLYFPFPFNRYNSISRSFFNERANTRANNYKLRKHYLLCTHCRYLEQLA